MPKYRGFDHYYRKAVNNGRSCEEAFSYAAQKHVVVLFDNFDLRGDTEIYEPIVDGASETYDLRYRRGESHLSACGFATRYMDNLVKKWNNQNWTYSRGKRGFHERAQSEQQSRSAFKDVDEFLTPLPGCGHGSLHNEDARRDEERTSRRPIIHVELCSGGILSGHRNQTTSRQHLSPSEPLRQSFFTPSPSPSPYIPQSPDYFMSRFANRQPMPADMGQSDFLLSQFTSRAHDIPRQPQYPNSSFRHNFEGLASSHTSCFGYSSEPSYESSSNQSYNTQEFRPSGNLRNIPPSRTSCSAHYTKGCFSNDPYTENHHSKDPRSGPTHRSFHSKEYHRDGGSPPSYSSNAPPPRSSPPRSPFLEDAMKPRTCLYIVLGIPRSAPADEVKKAYRKLSMKHHPDRANGIDKAKATDMMAEINQANDVLSDKKKRAFYDCTGCLPSITSI
jgi:hypothetical protein